MIGAVIVAGRAAQKEGWNVSINVVLMERLRKRFWANKMSQNNIGDCAYCGALKPLCKSHAIPNKFLKALKTDGKFVTYQMDKSYTFYTGQDGEGYLLCSACESDFNIRFDIPFSEAIQRTIPRNNIKSQDSKIIGRSLISFAWRASLLNTDMYSGFSLSKYGNSIFKSLLDGTMKIPENSYSIRILRIIDNVSGGDIDPFFIASAPRIKRTTIAGRTNVIISVMLSGFLFELFLPRIKGRFHSELNIVRFINQTHQIKGLRISDVPGFIDLVEGMNASIDSGRTSAAIKKLMRDVD